jgi:hypothetical protein
MQAMMKQAKDTSDSGPAKNSSGNDAEDARASTHSPSARLKRREMLRVLSTVPAAALIPLKGSTAAEGPVALTADSEAQAPRSLEKAPSRPKVLNEHEWKTVSLLSDMIIPADERSGSATQAGVPEFIDDWLGFKGGDLLAQVRGGLVWLDMESNRAFNRDFVDCTQEERKQMLDRIAFPRRAAPEDAPGAAFFSILRDLVVSGFFSSEMGVKDLPYSGNQMLSHWDGCPAEVLNRLGFSAAGAAEVKGERAE